MRPLPCLAAIVSVLAATAPVAATQRNPPRSVTHESTRIRYAPIGPTEERIAVDVDVTYLPEARQPAIDILHIATAEPTAVDARDADGRPLVTGSSEHHGIVVYLDRTGEPTVRRAHLHFEQQAPAIRRHGWRGGTTAIEIGAYALQSAGEVAVTVALSRDAQLPGFSCHRSGDHTECTRITRGRMDPIPLVLRARPDVMGMMLLALTVAAGVYGFTAMARKRAQEIVDAAKEVPPPEHERPDGAYRAPPAKTLRVTPGGETARLRRLTRWAVAIATVSLGSTIAGALFASGRSPWPMPTVTAAWIAVIAFIAARSVERA